MIHTIEQTVCDGGPEKQTATVFVSPDKEKAFGEFSRNRKFCKKAKNSKYTYRYILYCWTDETSFHIIGRCDNLDE